MSTSQPRGISKEDQAAAIGERLRILSVVTRFGAGGPPLNMLHLAGGMQKYGYETIIAAGASATQDADVRCLFAQRDKIEWVHSMSRKIARGTDFIALPQLIRLMRRYTPGIVQTFHGNVLRGYFNAFGSWCVQKLEQLFASVRALIQPATNSDEVDR